MSIANICSKTWQELQKLPPASYRPLCLVLIPVVTQLTYRFLRHNVYPHMTATAFDQKITQRNYQHKLFSIVVVIEVLTFAVFARSNRFYWIPAGYTLAHFIWTDVTKRQEVSSAPPTAGTPFNSMDGPKHIGN